MRGLFKIKPNERLGFKRDGEEIREHPFFANVNFEQILKKEIEAPISFKEAINDEGFDIDFEGSPQTPFNVDLSMQDKGLIFDGFTYFKAQLSQPKKE